MDSSKVYQLVKLDLLIFEVMDACLIILIMK